MKHIKRINEVLYEKPKETFFDIDETTTEELLSMIEYIELCYRMNKKNMSDDFRWFGFTEGYEKHLNSKLTDDIISHKLKDRKSLTNILYRIQKEFKYCQLLNELVDDFLMFIDEVNLNVKFDLVIDRDYENGTNIKLSLNFTNKPDAKLYSKIWKDISFVSDRYERFIISKISISVIEMMFKYEL